VIAPMLYMLKDDIANKLKKFVRNGGILLGTYITGYVNENCLCYQGGFPGNGMNELFGVISEEIDTLYPTDRNGIHICCEGLANTLWEVKDYAEILRVVDAKILGTYESDFYKGTAALTCKEFGKGKAYYQGARCDLNGMDDFFEKILSEAGVRLTRIPRGIELHRRFGDDKVYDFYLNISDQDITIENINGKEVISGEDIQSKVTLEPRKSIVIENGILV
ncbi:MAG: beta-galactosidase trimerization domain-containing protein, partial [Acetatifactor sp.]